MLIKTRDIAEGMAREFPLEDLLLIKRIALVFIVLGCVGMMPLLPYSPSAVANFLAGAVGVILGGTALLTFIFARIYHVASMALSLSRKYEVVR